jgi:hypothetical protein
VTNESLLTLSVAAMLGALALMLLCLALPTAWTIGAFLGPGLGLGGASILLYLAYVLRDLRRRGAL